MNKITLFLAFLFSIVAGILHTTIVAFEHVATPPLETIFFVFGGIAQVGIAVWFLVKKSFKVSIALFIANGALASVWVLTRLFRAPFMDTPEGVGTLGLSILLLELGSMISTAIWKWLQKHNIREAYGYSYAVVVLGAVVLSLTFGSFVFASGRLGEVVMPDREINHNHSHGGHSNTNDYQEKQNKKHQNNDSNSVTSSVDETKKKGDDNNENSNTQKGDHGHSDGHGHN